MCGDLHLTGVPLSRLVPEEPRPAHELLAEVRAVRARPRGPALRVREHGRDGRRARRRRRPEPRPWAPRLTSSCCSSCGRSPTPCSHRHRHAPCRGLRPPRRQPGAPRAQAGPRAWPRTRFGRWVLSRRFDIPWEAGLCQAPEQPVLIYTGPRRRRAAGHTRTLSRSSASRTRVPPPRWADLRARGIRALLSEGGPTLLRALVADLAPRRAVPDDRPRCSPGIPTEPTNPRRRQAPRARRARADLDAARRSGSSSCATRL